MAVASAEEKTGTNEGSKPPKEKVDKSSCNYFQLNLLQWNLTEHFKSRPLNLFFELCHRYEADLKNNDWTKIAEFYQSPKTIKGDDCATIYSILTKFIEKYKSKFTKHNEPSIRKIFTCLTEEVDFITSAIKMEEIKEKSPPSSDKSESNWIKLPEKHVHTCLKHVHDNISLFRRKEKKNVRNVKNKIHKLNEKLSRLTRTDIDLEQVLEGIKNEIMDRTVNTGKKKDCVWKKHKVIMELYDDIKPYHIKKELLELNEESTEISEDVLNLDKPEASMTDKTGSSVNIQCPPKKRGRPKAVQNGGKTADKKRVLKGKTSSDLDKPAGTGEDSKPFANLKKLNGSNRGRKRALPDSNFQINPMSHSDAAASADEVEDSKLSPNTGKVDNPSLGRKLRISSDEDVSINMISHVKKDVVEEKVTQNLEILKEKPLCDQEFQDDSISHVASKPSYLDKTNVLEKDSKSPPIFENINTRPGQELQTSNKDYQATFDPMFKFQTVAVNAMRSNVQKTDSNFECDDSERGTRTVSLDQRKFSDESDNDSQLYISEGSSESDLDVSDEIQNKHTHLTIPDPTSYNEQYSAYRSRVTDSFVHVPMNKYEEYRRWKKLKKMNRNQPQINYNEMNALIPSTSQLHPMECLPQLFVMHHQWASFFHQRNYNLIRDMHERIKNIETAIGKRRKPKTKRPHKKPCEKFL